jgi:hypothetical protein
MQSSQFFTSCARNFLSVGSVDIVVPARMVFLGVSDCFNVDNSEFVAHGRLKDFAALGAL